jgi:hypothetical protein
MQKSIAKKLDNQVQKVAERFSRKDREGNVNGEDFSVKSCYAMSDHTALVRFNKTTTKDALALFFYDEEYWKYFFPTDKHITGFRYFEHINISRQTWNITSECSDEENLNLEIQNAIKKFQALEHVNTMFMTSDTAAVRFTDKDGGAYLGFFYYINKGMSKGWRYFFPSESHLNGFRLFEFEKFNVEKENYSKNFIASPVA